MSADLQPQLVLLDARHRHRSGLAPPWRTALATASRSICWRSSWSLIGIDALSLRADVGSRSTIAGRAAAASACSSSTASASSSSRSRRSARRRRGFRPAPRSAAASARSDQIRPARPTREPRLIASTRNAAPARNWTMLSWTSRASDRRVRAAAPSRSPRAARHDRGPRRRRRPSSRPNSRIIDREVGDVPEHAASPRRVPVRTSAISPSTAPDVAQLGIVRAASDGGGEAIPPLVARLSALRRGRTGPTGTLRGPAAIVRRSTAPPRRSMTGRPRTAPRRRSRPASAPEPAAPDASIASPSAGANGSSSRRERGRDRRREEQARELLVDAEPDQHARKGSRVAAADDEALRARMPRCRRRAGRATR